MQVSCHIVKLVLRNNALTTLHGIENLKSLEGLDVSYNMISNFSELEFLAGLPHLQSLWLEGNPLSCARWYRAHVFSFFTYPEKVNLYSLLSHTRCLYQSPSPYLFVAVVCSHLRQIVVMSAYLSVSFVLTVD